MRWHIHWAWVPAAIFSVVVAVGRFGLVATVILVGAGLGLATYLEARARRRRR